MMDSRKTAITFGCVFVICLCLTLLHLSKTRYTEFVGKQKHKLFQDELESDSNFSKDEFKAVSASRKKVTPAQVSEDVKSKNDAEAYLVDSFSDLEGNTFEVIQIER